MGEPVLVVSEDPEAVRLRRGVVGEAKMLCTRRGIALVDLLRYLDEEKEAHVPAGHYVSHCGLCRRSSVVPTGETLKAVRERWGFRQTEVARLARCSKQHINDVESGRRNVPLHVAAAYRRLERARREEVED